MNSKDSIPVRNKFLRISKILGKIILGLILTLLIFLAIIHVPVVQQQITSKLTNYLSSKVESKIEIQSIIFSIHGNVEIKDLKVFDPADKKVFSAKKIEVKTNIFELVKGNFIFDEIHITGFEGLLTQTEKGLNIQFILDAFKPKGEPNPNTRQVQLPFKIVILENIQFKFISTVSGTNIDANLQKFTIKAAEFLTKPNTINVGELSLERAVVNILSIQQPDVVINSPDSTKSNPISLDFGIGIIIDIKDLKIKDSDFSFHKNLVTNTPKLDPTHLVFKNIQISLSDLLLSKDTLTANLQSLAIKMPGIIVSNAGMEIQMNRNSLNLSNLHITSNSNEIHADLKGSIDLDSAKNADAFNATVTVTGRIIPAELAYLFNDSLLNYFKDWDTTHLAVEGNYLNGKSDIKYLNLTTAKSQLYAHGELNEITDFKKINWKDMMIRTSMGLDFHQTLSSIFKNTKVPPDIKLQAITSGNLEQVIFDGNIFTAWGNVKAKGEARALTNNVAIDMKVDGEKILAGKWLTQSWLGPIDLSVEAKGIFGHDQDATFKGLISSIEIQGKQIHTIELQGNVKKESARAIITIEDPIYCAQINSEISFAGPLNITNKIQLDDFSFGKLLNMDSTLSISGDFNSQVNVDNSIIDGNVEGKSLVIKNQIVKYSLDTIAIKALLSPNATHFRYFADNGTGSLDANFDLRDSLNIISSRLTNKFNSNPDNSFLKNQAFNFNFQINDGSLFRLLGIDSIAFSSITMIGEFDQQKQTGALQATSGNFKGYGVSLDTMRANLIILPDTVTGGMNIKNLLYKTRYLGDLDFNLLTKGDTSLANLLLSKDSIASLDISTRVLPTDSGVFIYPDKLIVYQNEYQFNSGNPICFKDKNIKMDHFMITREDMQLNLNGDLNAFDVNFKNIDLTKLNPFLFQDSIIINNGNLTGMISYSKDHSLELHADIDSLRLYNSEPLTIAMTATRDHDQIPFKFNLGNTDNKVDFHGQYSPDNNVLDASLEVNVNNPEMFAFLFSGIIDDMNGTIKAKATVQGPLQKPEIKGYVRFLDAGITTSKPKLTFKIQDGIISLDSSGLYFKDFTIYDKEHNPLTIVGSMTTRDYQSFEYDLKINANHYALINTPDSSKDQLKGLLVIDSDIKLTGTQKNTYIKANVTIKDTTNLTFVNSTDDDELIKAEGVIEFVDPQVLTDSTLNQESVTFYDSLIATLPDFNMNSTINLEENAKIRIITDAQSGDYFAATGGAKIELGYDRTGNMRLDGNYTIKKGIYRVSFYNLVKKNFDIVEGSSIKWNGNPQNGDLDLKAVHTVKSNSLGLLGDEIGDNEKSAYKKSLPYEVGITIKGTVDKPIVTFSLDLPNSDRINYPVLANKLDRLKQPEFQSELNKQVFGLLVLGGFLPESSASDINENVVATTAISNSVNSLLASQLNRLASQYVKGVNVDVGIQSYSDYSVPGGKTATAMDFRVSKTVLDDRLSFEIGGDFDINSDQSGSNTGSKNYRGDMAITYDLTGNGDKKLKLFNNETYDIIYQEVQNTGISIVFIREFNKNMKTKSAIK